VKVIIGAILNLVPIINFLAAGYLVEATANAAREKHEMPAWEDWGSKFVKGLAAFVISFLYMLIPIIIFCAGGGEGLSGALVFLTGLALWFFLPMAVAHYAATGSFGAAFSLGAIVSYIGAAAGGYVMAYVFSIALFTALFVVSLIPVLGWVISLLGWFYVACVLAFLFGDVYRRAVSRGTGAGLST